MIRFACLLLCCCFAFSGKPRVRDKDFQTFEGQWKGSLSYRDYSTDKWTTIPSLLTVKRKPGKTWLFIYQYPEEPAANSVDTIQLEQQGRGINGQEVISRTTGSVLNIITRKKNPGDHSREFRYSWRYDGKNFSHQKEESSQADSFLLRFRYSFQR